MAPPTTNNTEVGEPFWIEQKPLQPFTTAPIIKQEMLSPSFPEDSNRLNTKNSEFSFSSVTWCEPDEAFLKDIKRLITVIDIKIFWEMAKAIMELPTLLEHSRSTILNSRDLAVMLKRIEYKFLWTSDALDFLPKDAAMELVSAAYMIT
jgi:hypothetical protein